MTLSPGATVNSDDVTVTINDQSAAVMNRTFFLPVVPLNIGDNTLTAIATDRAGNTATAAITLTREPDLAGLRILMVSGNAQTAPISTTLPEPLVVQVIHNDGTTEADRAVAFTVSRGDGLLDDSSLFQREITLLTDENGFAQIDFTLGSRTGEGFHRVLATTPGSLTFAEFCASAETGPPFNISMVMNPTIQSVVGQPLTQPIGAYVTDDGGNPIIDVPVIFQIQLGDGNFDGDPETTVLTNADGIAETSWTVGPNPGTSNNEATATFTGHIGFPVTYITSGVAPGPVEATTITGIVQDSLAAPIVGARAVLRGTDLEALTGEDGTFTITDVPPGGHHVGILGSAADDPGNNIFYPDIDFAIEVVSGVENKLDQIVVLPFLDMDNAQLVGGDEDVELFMADTEGFAIKVFANSTFIRDPDTGELVQQSLEMSSSQVKIDKIPMPPPQGATPLIVGTLQPAGVVFDPPAQVTYPNAEGFAPGDVADIFAFHHDIGQFVNIGPGTVTEDGDVITSDSGFGIVQSGWHCLIRIPGLLSQCTNINGCTISSITLTRTDVNMVSTNIDPGDPILLCINDQLEIDLEFEVDAPGDTTFGPGPQQFTEGWSFGGPLSLVESTEPFPKSFPAEETTAKIELQADNNGGSTQVTSPKFEFELKSTDDVVSAASCAAQFDIDVVRADLDIEGVDEADEETKGGFVCLNADDDNKNLTPDKDEIGSVTVTGEDDLLPITINLIPENLSSGTLELEVLQGGDKITVWTTAQKGTEFPLGEPLNVNTLSLPLMLYIEGIKESDSEKDIELRLHYTNGPIDCDDKIKLTTPRVELESVDRLVKGIIEVPIGVNDFGFSLRNKTSGEDIGTYSNILTGPSFFIYNSEDEIFTDFEYERELKGTLDPRVETQDVAVIRNSARKITFYTTFSDLGVIELTLNIDGNEITKEHTLLINSEVHDWIDQLDSVIENHENPIIVITAATSILPSSINKFSIQQPSSASLSGTVKWKGLIAKALKKEFEQVQTKIHVTNKIPGVLFFGFDRTSPNWLFEDFRTKGSRHPLHHGKHGITLRARISPSETDAIAQGIYDDFKIFANFNNPTQNIAEVSISGTHAHFDLNNFATSFGQMISGYDINVTLIPDDQNKILTAVTIGQHPLVGVRKWSVNVSQDGDDFLFEIFTEAWERSLFTAVEIAKQFLDGEEDMDKMWTTYITNTAFKWKPQLENLSAIPVTQTPIQKINDNHGPTSENPFRNTLPVTLQDSKFEDPNLAADYILKRLLQP